MTERELPMNERMALELEAMQENLIRAQNAVSLGYDDLVRIQNAISRTRAQGVLSSGVLKTAPWRFHRDGAGAYCIVCVESEKIIRALPAAFDTSFLSWIDLSDDDEVRLCVKDECTGPTLTIHLDMSLEDVVVWIEKLGIEVDAEAIADAVFEKEQEIARLNAIVRRFQRGSP